MLLRVASSINGDSSSPLRVPTPTIDFLRRLGEQCDHSTKPLGRFLLGVPTARLTAEIVRGLLPKDFHELRSELEELERAKEGAVAQGEWQQAAGLRDQSDALKARLREMYQGVVVDVHPEHILQALANLGFDQAIDLTGQQGAEA
jgi:hypothetical protein